MGDMMKLSRVSLFFFILIFNYLSLRVIVFPFMFNNYTTSGALYIIVFLFSVVPFFAFLPKRILNNNYFISYQRSKIKYLYNSILFIRIVFGIVISAFVLNKIFFVDYSIFWLLGGFFLVLFIISTLKPHEIIQIGTLFSILTTFIYIFYVYNYINLDFQLLFDNLSFNFDFMLFIIPYCIIFDNLSLLLVLGKNATIKKSTIVGALTLAILFFLFEYLNLSLISGDTLFLNNPMVGFIALSIEPVSRYNGNFDYIYILMIGVCSIFKFSYFFSLINNSTKAYKSKITYMSLCIACFVSSIGIYYLLINFYNIVITVVIAIFMSSLIFLLWILKEVYYARKTKAE